MAGLTDLIKSIGDENIDFQLLSKCASRYKVNKKHGDHEVTFITASDKVTSGKEAIIVWVDKEIFDDKLNEINKDT
ncbi:MAG: hypothetical protein Unbinned1520contig1002_17 [Prokaryotic dsDNA virus sp.]|nr:MAG: hypothetical protein Unbinned1520contig1002_17 [Prokaryotic dsDNA virus sp.]|tara:strand:- start:44 stop:271 length:228 start_codon:yes stop_codon:yes gene_type:complete